MDLQKNLEEYTGFYLSGPNQCRPIFWPSLVLAFLCKNGEENIMSQKLLYIMAFNISPDFNTQVCAHGPPTCVPILSFIGESGGSQFATSKA